MNANTHHGANPARDEFFIQEIHRLTERNRRLAQRFTAAKETVADRLAKRAVFATTCMDERTQTVEEALGLLPGEGYVYGSGGAKLELDHFARLYANDLKAAADKGVSAVVFLVTHLCGTGAEFGCAAFKNDVPAQLAYLKPLREAYKAAYPEFKVHLLMHDTLNDRLEAIVADESDPDLAAVLETNRAIAIDRSGNHAHAGYGVYIGDAYRAWVDEYNAYFRLAADNPNLAGNLGIAFAVMQHHSTVDLSDKPIMVHVDYPIYGDDAERTERARINIDEGIKEALRAEEIAELLAGDRIRVVKTETDMATWEGKSAGEPEFN
jgi:carbonic anhydrase